MNQENVTALELVPKEIQTALSDIVNFCASDAVAVSVKISDNAQYEASGELLKKLKKYKADVEVLYRNVKDPVVKQGKAIDNYFKPVTDKTGQLVIALTNALWGWKKKIVDDRRRAQAEADRKAAEEAAKAKEKAAKAKEKADEYLAQGRADMADKWAGKSMEHAIAAESVVAVPVAVVEAPKVAGLQMRETVKGRCVDKAALMAWCVTSGMVNLFDVNEAALNAQARACKGEMKIPGVEWYLVASSASSRG